MCIDVRDLIIVLPGILGSVLERDGREVWGLSGQALSSYLRSRGGSVADLILERDDLEADEAPDGVKATKMISDLHIIPGFWKVDGYTRLTKFLLDNVNVEPGVNLLPFPYDWRRDNRATAGRLARFVERTLREWRRSAGSDAKVILLAHSMGGLVARYYIEVLGGWKSTRALITFATPYRGSLNALNFLFNGRKIGWADVSEMLRSLPAVYQLLPTYPCVRLPAGDFVRPAELPDAVCFDSKRAKEAREGFHNAMNQAAETHRGMKEYESSYKLLPVIGIEQMTLQCAQWDAGSIETSAELPEGMDPQLQFGDGTVPLASAVPLERSEEWGLPFHAEKHGCVHTNVRVLGSVREWLRQSQVRQLRYLKGEPKEGSVQQSFAGRPFIRLQVEDQYAERMPIRIQAQVYASEEPSRVFARLDPSDPSQEPGDYEMVRNDAGWEADLPPQPIGCYRIRVLCRGEMEAVPPPVSDLLQVEAGL